MLPFTSILMVQGLDDLLPILVDPQSARFRVRGLSWWPEEMPSEAEYAGAEPTGWILLLVSLIGRQIEHGTLNAGTSNTGALHRKDVLDQNTLFCLIKMSFNIRMRRFSGS